MRDFVKVAKTNEIKPGQARLIDIRGKRVALFNIEGNYYAIDDTCTHQGGPLSDGEIVGSHVTCPWHGATFDLAATRFTSSRSPVQECKYKYLRMVVLKY